MHIQHLKETYYSQICNISLILVFPEYVCEVSDQNPLQIILKMPILSGSMLKHAVYVHVSLNANVLLLPAPFFRNRSVPIKYTKVYVKNTHELQKQSVMSVKINSWERNCMFILYLCSSSIIHSK